MDLTTQLHTATGPRVARNIQAEREVANFRLRSSIRDAERSSKAPSKRTNVRLWVTQGALAALFLFAGVSKLVMPADELTKNTDLSAEFLRFIGLCEALGAVGLVLPWALGIRRSLTPLAAAGLVVIMVGATVLTAAAGDVGPAAIPFVVGLLSYTVVAGRKTGATAPASN